jgi:TetR/AcrR family transcriptional regulator, mexJK operon transcriptional repressor
MNQIAVAPVRTGRPKDMHKRHAILDAATQLFIRDGFERTSMDAVARLANVSKATLYSHFADKEAILVEGLHRKVESMAVGDPVKEIDPEDVRAGLYAMGHAFWNGITSPVARGIEHLILQESERHPQLGAMFFEHAILYTCRRVDDWFAVQHEAGRLHVPDPRAASLVFISTVKGLNHLRLLTQQPVDPADIERNIRIAVDVVMQVHAPRPVTQS